MQTATLMATPKPAPTNANRRPPISPTSAGLVMTDQVPTAPRTVAATNRYNALCLSIKSAIAAARLTSATTSAITDGWTYDANGNRLTQTGTTPITFTVSPTSNQVTATSGSLVRTYSYDAAGNATSNGTSFTYNDRGRMASTSGSSTLYLYNALGQMIEKSGTPGTTVFMQDEAGHLVGEYSSTGTLVDETVWLGDIPVATLQPNGSGGVNIYYVHSDHLNAPRKVSQPSSNTLVWRWDTDPFGTTAANQNPAGLGTFVYDWRFPGQMYMAETAVNQNYFRDYDPAVGRFVESDPIGLQGGVNSYTYAFGNPSLNVDPSGLDVTVGYFPGQTGHVGIAVNSDQTQGLYPLGSSIGLFFCQDVSGVVLGDQATQDATSKSRAQYIIIHTTTAQDATIQRYIQAARDNKNQSYNACSNQCTTFVRGALQAAGVPLPIDAISGIGPMDFFNSLQRRYGRN
jgi:RHS repeat-associated protein